MKVDIYVEADLQPQRKDRWSAYIIKSPEYPERESGLAILSYSTANEAVICTIIKALDRFIRPAEITIHIRSRFVLDRVTRYKRETGPEQGRTVSDLEMWQKHGWRTARGTEVKNRDEWQRLYNKLRVFEQSGGVFTFKELNMNDEIINKLWSMIETANRKEA